jgi:aspartate aminotransferase-like enzyme
VDTFRIGNIGRLFPEDMGQLVQAIGAVLLEMGCELPLRKRSVLEPVG